MSIKITCDVNEKIPEAVRAAIENDVACAAKQGNKLDSAVDVVRVHKEGFQDTFVCNETVDIGQFKLFGFIPLGWLGLREHCNRDFGCDATGQQWWGGFGGQDKVIDTKLSCGQVDWDIQTPENVDKKFIGCPADDRLDKRGHSQASGWWLYGPLSPKNHGY